MNNPQQWYIIKQEDGTCQITAVADPPSSTSQAWGPFTSQQEAIAKKIGLIRAGKCKPQ
jgi:hypothetical protein